MIAQRSVVVTVALLLLLLLLGGLAWTFHYAGQKLFSENPRFRIQHLVVSCDGRLTEQMIRDASGLREDMNLFSFGFDEIEEKLEVLPVVESVELTRELPSTLYVHVKERVPVARIMIGDYKVPRLLDRYGYLLPPRVNAELERLPLVKGYDHTAVMGTELEDNDIDYALEIIGLCESKQYLRDLVPIDTMDITYDDFIDIRLRGSRPTRVRMPRFQMETKLYYLASVIEFATSQGKRIKEIDLTLNSEKAPVRYY
ncbi:MAG: FtsQ-type POTRA domain-containing protein [Pontiellaceae bacterium]|nr:FtsQ-type POTRA domain-containing protein [Pontiellaceae bacterium]MBN2786374.1 FtsQ-type POTRA domain-containing protein [Pontiellaceae bacterium]